jgi:hypothetical protein
MNPIAGNAGRARTDSPKAVMTQGLVGWHYLTPTANLRQSRRIGHAGGHVNGPIAECMLNSTRDFAGYGRSVDECFYEQQP